MNSLISIARKIIPKQCYEFIRNNIQSALYLSRKKKNQLERKFPKLPIPNTNGKLFLHLGCGEIDAKGFVNIDAISRPHVHYVRAIDDLAIFDDESVDFIFASHCLEHFSHRMVPKVLMEWNRVLVKGGILCLSVPDFDCMIDIYNNNSNDIESILGPLMGGQDYKYNFHMTAFNSKFLTDLLFKANFSVVRPWIPDADELHSVDGWARRNIIFKSKEYKISLNIEAVK